MLRFDGLQLDSNVTPMDLDGLIEYHDRKIMLFEVKLGKTPVPYGEKTALERMVNNFYKAGKDAIAVVAEHQVFDTKEDVIVKDCLVRELYYGKEKYWRAPKRMMTVEMLTNSFLFS